MPKPKLEKELAANPAMKKRLIADGVVKLPKEAKKKK